MMESYHFRMTTTHSTRYREMLQRLRSAREKAGMTQSQVAAKLKQYNTYVCKCESGERRIDFIELERFADLYDKKITWFIPKK